MNKNVGNIDKVLRVAIGIVVILLGIIYQSWWGLVGIIPLFTGFMGTCPLYMVLHLSTRKKNSVA